MPTTPRSFAAALLCLAIAAVPRPASAAAAYPVNACVSTKQKEAGNYCSAVLKAWSKYETAQDAADRDATLADAADKLDGKWLQAETKSSDKGSDCADATLSASALRVSVDSAIAAIIGDVNA